MTHDLLPNKSRKLYYKAYNEFLPWKMVKKTTSCLENVLLAYFNDLSDRYKVTSLWTKYSKSKSTDIIPKRDIEEQIEKQCTEKAIINRQKSNFVEDYIRDYTSNSNLHGIKYIGDKERTLSEKIFWFFTLICCIFVCGGLIGKVWIKWTQFPVIVSFEEKVSHVWQIPFPAVTICLQTKAMPERFNYTHYFHLYNTSKNNMSDYERKIFKDVTLVCPEVTLDFRNATYDGNSTVTNLFNVAPNLTEFFSDCQWNNVQRDCRDLFSPTLTEEGVCFSFNMLRAEELFRLENLQNNSQYIFHQNKSQFWTLENGYAPMTSIETYPRRGVGYGAEAALSVKMKNKHTDLDYVCGGPMQGSKILLHNPVQLPRPKQQYFRLPLTQQIVVAVKPKVMSTTKGLKEYDADRRHCFFQTDRNLQYFKVYTQSNCEFECLTNYTLALCGCVPIGMPNGKGIKTCSDMNCVIKARRNLEVEAIKLALNKKRPSLPSHESSYDTRHVATQCNCLPGCISIDYEAETSQDNIEWEPRSAALNLNSDKVDKMMYSHVMIFFKDQDFIKSRRSELYGLTDFIANCGGLLGLFMGFSILSVVEIIYFLTLRLFNVIWTRKANKKKN